MNTAKIVCENGYQKIQINNKIFDPVMYRSFRPSEKIIKQFYSAGCRLMMPMISGLKTAIGVPYSLFGEFWSGEGQYHFDVIDAQLDMFISAAPDAYFSLMIQIDTREWYLEQNKDAVNSFLQIRAMASDEHWRACVARMIQDVLAHVEEKYPNKLFCVYIAAGGTCEWLTRDFSSPAPQIERNAYKRYCEKHGIQDSEFPTYFSPKNGQVFDPVQESAPVNVWKFRNEAVCDALLYFANVVKECSNGNLLTGAFFGYVAESTSLNNNHLYFNKLLSSNSIDILSAPASYTFRKLDKVSAEMPPVDSITLSKKLYFHEIDQITRSPNPDAESKSIIEYLLKLHPPFERDEDVIHYYKREMACAVARRQGFWWFDMFGGWYDDPRMMSLYADSLSMMKELTAIGAESASEIAVIIDLHSAPYNRGTITGILNHQREQLGRLGAPVDYYISDSLFSEDFPLNRIKLFLFMNLTYPTASMKEKVAQLRVMGKCLVFFSAAGYITENGFNMESATSLTGASPEQIQNCLSDGTSPVNDAKITITYENGSRFDAWCSTPAISPESLRALAGKANVDIYSEDDLPIYANSTFLSIFSNERKTATVHLKDAEKLLDLSTGETIEQTDHGFQISLLENECRMFKKIRKENTL